jgi:hypothetical protein
MMFRNSKSLLFQGGVALIGGLGIQSVQADLIQNLGGTGSTGSPAAVVASAPLAEGSVVYQDRVHTYSGIPSSLLGLTYVQTRNSDKNQTSVAITFDLTAQAAVFLLIDNRIGDGIGGITPATGTDNPPTLGNGVMDWVGNMGFKDTGLDVGIDENANGDINNTYSVFSATLDAGSYTFGTQYDTTINGPGGRNFYTFAVAPVPEPSTMALVGLGAAGLLFRVARRR